MRNILLLGLAAVSLAGCNVTQNQIDSARTGYDAAFLTPAAHYRNLGFCATGTAATLAKPCADRAVVAKLVAEDNAVKVALANLQAQVASGNTAGASAAFSVLQTAISVAEASAVNLGVN